MSNAISSANLDALPEQGQLVEVRRRQWVVSEVSASGLLGSRPQHLVTLNSIDEDALGEEIQVVWEIEPGTHVLEKAGLPDPTGFDDPARLDAFLDAVRWGAATNADIQMVNAPFRSGIAIEDYQLDPLIRALDMPRVNLLIADDVGLGKTIEAGLVVQELLLRHRARTVLVVCPASLQIKWQREMLEKFGLDFRIVDSDYMKELRRTRGIHTNPWSSYPRLITSIDWLKGDMPMRRMRETLPVTPGYPREFDILILDEAHNVAPAGSGRYAIDSLRTKAIRSIAPHFDHRLFLTATPHNGYQESFTSLLEILDDQRFARGVVLDAQSLGRVMVRRLKTEIVDKDGKEVFPHRVLEPLEVEYTDEERRIHRALREYAELRLEAARDETGNYATEFVLKLLKKRLFSSPAAFAITLERHRESLEGRRRHKEKKLDAGILRRAIQQADEEYANDDQREEFQVEAIGAVGSLLERVSDRERALLDEMSRWAATAKDKADSKAKAIIGWVNEHVRPEGVWSGSRVIIFTEYRATQKWLVDVLSSAGFGGQDRLVTIYGGMDSDKREAVKAAFQADPEISPVRILVATDAAAEGIDLQNHCSLMLHSEIPWNPNVLEQRNGRIDRHGQRAKNVRIWHPVGKGYRDQPVNAEIRTGDLEGDLEFLMVAARKVDRIREDLGKVGPVITRQLEEAMLGHRRRFETDSAEKDAAKAKRQLDAAKRFQAKVDRLHQRLIESKESFGLSPENVRRAVEVALDIAKLPSLQPVELKRAPSGTVFRMPEFPGTWARCGEGLLHPHTGERRPITFDHEISRGRDDVVLVHLNHRLTQMSLRLLRAEVWQLSDVKNLHRISAKTVPDDLLDVPALIGFARLVVTGASSRRLHEEVIFAGGKLAGEKFERIANVTDVEALIRSANSTLPVESVLEKLLSQWEAAEARFTAAIEARASDRMRYLRNTLERRRDREIEDIRNVLTDLRESIETELRGPKQFDLLNEEEQNQLRRNLDGLEARMAEIPDEIDREVDLVHRRYSEPISRTFPVAATFLVPESMANELS